MIVVISRSRELLQLDFILCALQRCSLCLLCQEVLNRWMSGLLEPSSKGMRAFLAGTGQNWTSVETCAVLRLNLVQSVRDKKKKENAFFEVVHISYAGPTGRTV